MGILSMIILSTANLLYFISAYYSYGVFRFRFFSKLGSRPAIHSMFTWVQFNNSMMKMDFGLIIFFLMVGFCFNRQIIALIVIDCVVAVILFLNIYFMRTAVSMAITFSLDRKIR
jgi:hypothetical protein